MEVPPYIRMYMHTHYISMQLTYGVDLTAFSQTRTPRGCDTSLEAKYYRNHTLDFH